MQLDEFKIQTNGCEIYGCHARPDLVKGAVVLVHGLGEHSGRYVENVLPMLLESSLAVVLYDNVGHGRSAGKHGHCPSYGALMDILEQVILHTETLYPSVPLLLYGHSMGGNLTLNYTLRKPNTISGIIATSPYLRLAFQPPKWKMVLGKLMLKLAPMITLPSGLDPNGISRIPGEVEKYSNDPLVHDRVSPMFSFPIMEAGEWAIANASQLTVDTLLLHGTADPIIDYRGTEQFHRNSDKTQLKLIEGGYHELHYDECKEEMLRFVGDWIKRRFV